MKLMRSWLQETVARWRCALTRNWLVPITLHNWNVPSRVNRRRDSKNFQSLVWEHLAPTTTRLNRLPRLCRWQLTWATGILIVQQLTATNPRLAKRSNKLAGATD